ncbi:MAG: V-type ATPase subunit, partial [Candidatus Wallbacteria bacterium]|nr:V-type ATPase subunit [Candidatus Wallbacteria bacterium]
LRGALLSSGGRLRGPAGEFIGYFIDTSAILDLLRLRFCYSLKPDECKGWILPTVFLSQNTLSEMAGAGDLAQAIGMLSGTRYEFLGGQVSVSGMEKRIWIEKETRVRRYFSSGSFNAGLIFAYFWMSELEQHYFGRLLEARGRNWNALAEEELLV